MRKPTLRNINFTRIFTKLLIVASLVVLASTAYFVVKLDVLVDWRIEIPTATEYHAGDTIVVESIYTKLRQVEGEARRYVECETRPGVYVSYLVNEVPADRRAGSGGTGIEIPIPRGIANLPTDCRIRISIDYPVLPFRHVTEVATSDTFRLLPEREEDRIRRESGNENVSDSQNIAAQVPASSQNVSYPNNTPPNQTETVTNDTQTPDSPTIETPELERQPGVVEGLIRGVDEIVSNVTNLLGGN